MPPVSRKITFILFLTTAIIGSVVFYDEAFSYDTDTAHPFLTREAVELFNQNAENKISEEEIEWIVQGAIEEDTPIRWMNHFYDPNKQKGLFGFSSAKDWTKQNIKQSFYPKGNQTWQKAVDLYVDGKKEEAFIALGHILHLIEDMAVPAHTRDDPHALGDPYESWVEENGVKEFDGISVSEFDNIDIFFDSLSEYSNKYFLSKDTIDESLLKNLKTKTVFLDDKIIDCHLFYDSNGNEFCIISSDKNFINSEKVVYYFTEINHSGYYSLLAPKAISYGAGLIDLFFKEIAKEKQKESQNQPAETQSAIIQMAFEKDTEEKTNLEAELPSNPSE